MRKKSDRAMSCWRRDLEGAEEPSFLLGSLTGSRFRTHLVVYSSESIPSQHNGVPSAQEILVITPAARVAAAFSVLLSYYEKKDDGAFAPLRVRIEADKPYRYVLSTCSPRYAPCMNEYKYVGLYRIANLNVKGAREACAFRTLSVVSRGVGSDLNVHSPKGEELQIMIVEEDTFVSLNYGFVIVLTTDRPICQSKLRAEFDLRYITEQ
ncbi:hypothetical protein ANO14919_142880 [Xylariales sp. No.14919]|nr:hypothetical protein ANO14919_142880 [Xylariales sp. No.14919]